MINLEQKAAGLLAVCALSAGMAATAYGATSTFEMRKNVVSLLGIITTSNTQATVTRAEFARMLMNASDDRQLGRTVSNVSVFADVPSTSEYATAIRTASANEWMSGYLGGKTDVVLMRIVDMFQSVPSLLMIIVIFSFVPNNMITLVLMLALFSWTGVARIVRAQTLTLKERDFVIAAKTLGVSHPCIILQHIIPNMTTQIIVAASLSIAGAILDESALSYLGYGVALPKSSWGSMLQNAQQYILYDPLLALIPGLFILMTVLCLNILGDVLQHALDPRLHK